MNLKLLTEIYDKNILAKFNTLILKDVSNESAFANYSLFDCFNILKLRRMLELSRITQEKYNCLYKLYRAYMTKLSEINNYAEVDKSIIEEFIDIKNKLGAYEIITDPTVPLFSIADVVNLDIDNDIDSNISKIPSKIIEKDAYQSLNESFNRIIKETPDKRLNFYKIFNEIKLELLAERKIIFKNHVNDFKLLYEKSLETDSYRNELSADPFNLKYDDFEIDLISLIDNLILCGTLRDKEVIEDERKLSVAIR